MVQDNKLSNIKLRIISGIVIGTLFLTSILWIEPLFYIMILGIAIIMFLEWYEMTKSSFTYLLFGLVIIPPSITSLLLLKFAGHNEKLLIIYFFIIWSVDSFAMMGGKKIKGPKLAPKLSPNKTWSGLITGVTGSVIIYNLVKTIPFFNVSYNHLYSQSTMSFSVMFIAVTAQLSDLFISYFKRKFGIKDSGRIIPGHGGVLDRFDSIILTAPILLKAYYL